MLIKSTRLGPKPTVKPSVSSRSQQQHAPAGVILAVNRSAWKQPPPLGPGGHVDGAMYVFRAKAAASDPLASEVAELAKKLSTSLADQVHPHLGTGLRIGWTVVGAISLLNRASSGNLAWHEVALRGGQLGLDAYCAANSALPDAYQWNTDWCEGVSCLIEATQHVSSGGDAQQFVLSKAVEQPTAVEPLQQLLSMAVAAEHPHADYSFAAANPIDVTIESAANAALLPGSALGNKRRSA